MSLWAAPSALLHGTLSSYGVSRAVGSLGSKARWTFDSLVESFSMTDKYHKYAFVTLEKVNGILKRPAQANCVDGNPSIFNLKPRTVCVMKPGDTIISQGYPVVIVRRLEPMNNRYIHVIVKVCWLLAVSVHFYDFTNTVWMQRNQS